MEKIWEKLAQRFGQETIDKIRGAIDQAHRHLDARQGHLRARHQRPVGVRPEPAQQPVEHRAPGGDRLDHGADRQPGRRQAAEHARPDRDHGRDQRLHRLLQRGPVGDRVPPRDPRDRRQYVATIAAVAAGDIEPGAAQLGGRPRCDDPGRDRVPRQPGRPRQHRRRRSPRSSAGSAQSSTRPSTGCSTSSRQWSTESSR